MPDALTTYDVPQPRGLVILLHGGKQRSQRPVDGRSASWRRALALGAAIAPALAAGGVSLWVVRNTVAGWNDLAAPSPVPDARRVLGQAPALPVVLLGHSMGARTAVHVADDPRVVGVVGLAPWWPEGEPVDRLAGRHLLGVHGSRDRITSPAATRAYVDRARGVARSAAYEDMGPVGHYLLRRAAGWNAVAVRGCLAQLDAEASRRGPGRPRPARSCG